MASATIKIFLAHGDPKRLRTAELSNWTGKAIAGPRSEFESVLVREESELPRVYRRLHFLRGWSHEQVSKVFTGSPGTGGPAGF